MLCSSAATLYIDLTRAFVLVSISSHSTYAQQQPITTTNYYKILYTLCYNAAYPSQTKYNFTGSEQQTFACLTALAGRIPTGSMPSHPHSPKALLDYQTKVIPASERPLLYPL